jgi:hypothetical protein
MAKETELPIVDSAERVYRAHLAVEVLALGIVQLDARRPR